VGDVLPLPGDNVQFGNTGFGTLTTINDFPVGHRFGALIFTGGKQLVQGNLAQLDGGISMDYPGNVEIQMPLSLGANQTFSLTHSNAFLTMSTDIDVGSSTLTIHNENATTDGLNPAFTSVILAGVVSGPGRLIKTGPEGLFFKGIANCSETIVNEG